MNICSVIGCNNKYRASGYCDKHYKQIRTHGKILERTNYDPNEIIVDDNVCRIKLYNRDCKEIAETTFDLKYKEEIEKYKWHLHRSGYTETWWCDENKKVHKTTLHQAIIALSGQEVPDGYEIDHKDGNKLNCLESNLRICTNSQNKCNVKIRTNSKSGAKGVTYHNQTGKWQALISINCNPIFLGLFDTIEDAAKAYNEAAIQHHGEFAVLNNI